MATKGVWKLINSTYGWAFILHFTWVVINYRFDINNGEVDFWYGCLCGQNWPFYTRSWFACTFHKFTPKLSVYCSNLHPKDSSFWLLNFNTNFIFLVSFFFIDFFSYSEFLFYSQKMCAKRMEVCKSLLIVCLPRHPYVENCVLRESEKMMKNSEIDITTWVNQTKCEKKFK